MADNLTSSDVDNTIGGSTTSNIHPGLSVYPDSTTASYPLPSSSPQSGHSIEYFPSAIVFNDEKTGKRVGRIGWEKGKLVFEGNLNQSAKRLLEVLKNYISLDNMRK